MFKNVLRTFEAEIPKIFKNIQPQPKNSTFLYKKKSAFTFNDILFLLSNVFASFYKTNCDTWPAHITSKHLNHEFGQLAANRFKSRRFDLNMCIDKEETI